MGEEWGDNTSLGLRCVLNITCIGLWPFQKLWPGKYLRELDKWFNHSIETTASAPENTEETQDVSETSVVHEKKDTDI